MLFQTIPNVVPSSESLIPMSSLALGDCLSAFSAFRPYNGTTVLPPTTAYNFLPSLAAFSEAMNNAALSQSVSPIDILAATSSTSSSLLPVVSPLSGSSATGPAGAGAGPIGLTTKTPPINLHAVHVNKHSPPLHHQQPVSKKRQRTTFTPQQAATLEREYLNDQYMPRQRRQLIAESLNLNESQVKTWFQNRRAKEKRTDKAQQACRSSTSPQTETLLASAVAENPQSLIPATVVSSSPVHNQPNYAMILQSMQMNQKLQQANQVNPIVLPPF
ncbi:hypothetical protein L596_001915 [Steinernema carpocapsae]|uniref:Homeobox domain-containing protein n=1 Tax=Steinernema carpocapsae TaxID=34508 RepID=A0A4U8UNN3_STECR|nr:hypothetical protein L596_001915 [Steinernema carpocapsae]